MEDGGGAGEPMDPLGQARPPVGHPGGRVLPSARSHLFQALHVLEVEADVEEAQVGIDELELWEAGSGHPVVLCPVPRSPAVPCLLAATHQNNLDNEVLLVGAL